MAEGMVGRQVRCIACNQRFLADPEVLPPPPPPRPVPAHPPAQQSVPIPQGGPGPRADEPEFAADGRPFCPGCGRRVNWDWITCFHCGEQFDLSQDGRRRDRDRFRDRTRRDTIPHRGALIANLGNITLAVGALSLCLFGVGLVVTLPLGVATIVLATTDLGQMRMHQMDIAGRVQTENGRTAAVVGLVLSVVFAAGWALLYLSRIF
jgi:hypothetical protein